MGLTLLKIKKSRVPSTDPFECLDSFLHDLIVQHLRGNEVLNAFKVSRSWNHRFSESSAAMEKIRLVFYDSPLDKHQRRRLEKLLQSQRKYQKLEFELTSADCMTEKMLILTHFSPRLVELEMSASGHDDRLSESLSECLSGISLPRLRSLEISELWPTESAMKLMNAAPIVTRLSLTTHRSLGGEFFECLMSKNNVKELSVYAIDFFRSPVFSPKFALTKLAVKTYSLLHRMQNDRIIFEAFMLRMADTLTHLEFESCEPNDMNLIVNRLKVLRTLIIRDIRGDRGELKLQANHSITEFMWNGYDEDNYWPIMDVIEPLTNLEVFDVKCFEMNSFKWMLKSKQKLKMVIFGSWNYSSSIYDHAPHALFRVSSKDVSVLYENLKFSDPSLNQNVKFLRRSDRYRFVR